VLPFHHAHATPSFASQPCRRPPRQCCHPRISAVIVMVVSPTLPSIFYHDLTHHYPTANACSRHPNLTSHCPYLLNLVVICLILPSLIALLCPSTRSTPRSHTLSSMSRSLIVIHPSHNVKPPSQSHCHPLLSGLTVTPTPFQPCPSSSILTSSFSIT
jgi:hypothetical protein